MSVKGDDGKVRQVELDLVGKEGSKVVLIGECKFRNQRFGKAELDALRTKIDLLPIHAPRIVLFSLSGFTPDVLAEDVLAVDIDAMYERD
jgi:hypothetical protein